MCVRFLWIWNPSLTSACIQYPQRVRLKRSFCFAPRALQPSHAHAETSSGSACHACGVKGRTASSRFSLMVTLMACFQRPNKQPCTLRVDVMTRTSGLPDRLPRMWKIAAHQGRAWIICLAWSAPRRRYSFIASTTTSLASAVASRNKWSVSRARRLRYRLVV